MNAMEETGGCKEICMAVDSGPTEAVVGEDLMKGVETKPGDARRSQEMGEQCEVASEN